ncbi:MAG: laccase domain-containing protein [Lactobacillus sp.]|jgi:YfiH family protein|nr:laccase domain-containing protein [Lactobacillus sp.]
MNYFAPNLPKDKHCFYDKDEAFSNGSPANLVALEQKFHTDKAVYVDAPTFKEIVADGSVTKNPNLLISVRTADCVPLLYADYKNGVIGASHGGWRGALNGVIENTLDLMIENGASKDNIAAAIGPCLQKPNFETRQDMYNLFVEKDPSFSKYFEKKDAEHYLFDIEQFVYDKLTRYGITNISRSGIDTYTSSDRHSYRRNCHQKYCEGVPVQYAVIRL